MRTSTATLVEPPTRWKVWSTSTRRILFCVSRGMSAISSMNSVPPCASSSAPTLRACAPLVCSTPNSSISMRSGVIAAALMTTNGPFARADRAWIVRAASSLPAPDGPDDQDAAVGRRHLLDGLAQLVDRRRAADHRRRHRAELLELLDLALEPRGLERALGDQHQPVGLERLLDEVVGAALDRRDRGLDVAVAGDHHDRQFGMLLLDRVEQLQPVEPAALQPDVEEDQVGPARRDRAERVVAVARRARGVALVLQDAGDQLADVGFVVDDENVGRHDYRSLMSQLSCAVFRFGRRSRRRPRSRREPQPHPGAALPGTLVGGIAQLDAAAVLLQDPADDGETEAGALLARRDVGLEQPVAVLLRQPDAVVDHVDDDVAALARGDDADAAPAALALAAPPRSPRSRS